MALRPHFFSDHSPKFTNSIIDKCWLQAVGHNEVDGFVGEVLFVIMLIMLGMETRICPPVATMPFIWWIR